MNYNLNDDLTSEQFEVLRKSGAINSQATYQDYLELKRERTERRHEAKANGLVGCEPPELTGDDIAIFMKMHEQAEELNKQPLAA